MVFDRFKDDRVGRHRSKPDSSDPAVRPVLVEREFAVDPNLEHPKIPGFRFDVRLKSAANQLRKVLGS